MTKKSDSTIKKIFIANVIIAVFFLAYSAFTHPIYIFDSIIHLILTYIFWKHYKSWNQNVLVISMLSLVLLAHHMGIFGFYTSTLIAVPYDKFVHFMVGVVSSYSVLLFAKTRVNRSTAFSMVLIGVLGFSAFVEVIEFVGYSIARSGTFHGGFLDPGVLDKTGRVADLYFDTLTDIILGLLGAAFTLAVTSLRKFKTR